MGSSNEGFSAPMLYEMHRGQKFKGEKALEIHRS
jgi:hypothetical protein